MVGAVGTSVPLLLAPPPLLAHQPGRSWPARGGLRAKPIADMPQKHFEFLKTLDGHMDAVWASCASKVNDDLYTASWDGRVGVWDLVTSENKFMMEGHRGKVFCVACGHDSQANLLVSGGEDKAIRSWSLDTGECGGSMDDAHDGSVVS